MLAVVSASFLFAEGDLSSRLEPPEPAPVRLHLRLTKGDAPENVVWGFFDPVHGQRVARMRVGRIDRDFGKQGVFRVAWKARAVLSDVEIELSDAEGWRGAAGQLADLLDSLGSLGQAPVLRSVSVTFPSGTRFTAPEAFSTGEGRLILPEATVNGHLAQRVVFHLRGDRAGAVESTSSDPPLKQSSPP